MELYVWLIIVAALFPFALRLDYKEKQKAEADPEKTYDPNGMLSSGVLMFTPYSLLFYTEGFWTHLLFFVPFFLYCFAWMYFFNQKQWLDLPFTYFSFTSLGQFMLVILAYFLFFHDGYFSDQVDVPEGLNVAPLSAVIEPEVGVIPSAEVIELSAVISVEAGPEPSTWPYMVFGAMWLGIIFFSALGERSKGFFQEVSGLMIMAGLLAFPILPFFMADYWSGMLIGLLGFISAIVISTNFQKDGASSVHSAFTIIYMYAAFASVIVYAFLY